MLTEDSFRFDLEQQVKTLLKAARYLASCSQYGEAEFDAVQDILSSAPLGGAMDSQQKAQLKQSVQYLLPQRGVGPWDQVRIMDHKTLSEAITLNLQILTEARPGRETTKFVRWAIGQAQEISDLIGKMSPKQA